jgi:serine/threonine protein kinase
MGEVYRARDTRLGRDVAVKALPSVFASDPARLARFEREAQVLATLNHPNLAIIHELKEVDGSKYLILELVEGETLAERIRRGPIPVDEALNIARQIAEALEVAHDKGIVHRDLKPANIKVTPEGRVKVLDFGLAKIQEAGNSSQSLSNSPTLSAIQTAAGVILGTAAYMSPEQARNKEVDRRTDVWAFGCVLYEMLSGRQAFPVGQTVSDTIAGILVRDPDWRALPPSTPAKVRALLERCLRKDERRRWSDMADVCVEIDEARWEREASTIAAAVPATSRRREMILAALALLFFLTATAGAIWLFFGPRTEARPMAVEVISPTGVADNSFSLAELSPDGLKVAVLANTGGKRLIWVRPLDSIPQPLTGTEGTGTEIFWSSDSQYIGFFAEGKLKKVAASGGPSQVVANLPPSGVFAGTWSADGVILLGSEETAGPLLRVPAAGGESTPASELDASRKETSHAYPYFLPDGRHYLFLARSSDSQNTSAAYVGDLDSRERHPLPGIASEVKYSPSGHIVYIRDGALMAQPFDAKRLQLSGDAFPVADAFVAASAVAGHFSVSSTGRAAYFKTANPAARGANSQLAWRDRSGAPLGPAGPEGEYRGPELSPDGKRVAFARGTPGNIWLLDIERSLAEPLTTDPADDSNPRWSPDGKIIAFQSTRDGKSGLYVRAVGVVSEDQAVLQDQSEKILGDWSPDGRYLAYAANGDIWVLPITVNSKPAEAKPLQITKTEAVERTPRISPDGRWIAYVSNEPGQDEVYVQSFPEPGIRLKVSTAGGVLPRWSWDSKELFYRQPAGQTVWRAVAIKSSGGSLNVDAPVNLFGAPINTAVYSVSRSGRFLVQLNPGTAGGRGNPNFTLAATPPHVVVLINWGKRGSP